MSEEKVTIEFKYPWSMMPLQSSGEWIDAVSKSLPKSDPLYGKQIFVSAKHDIKKLILVDNDSDSNYAILSYSVSKSKSEFKTEEILASRKALAEKLKNDYEAIKQKD